MADRVEELRGRLADAKANGWYPAPHDPQSLMRRVEHVTPDFAKANGWWPCDAYTSIEFLAFVFTDRNRVPKVIHKVSRCPWVERRDQKITWKACLALLAQPVAESPVHS